MNLEEIDKWLDNEYGVSYTSLEKIYKVLPSTYNQLLIEIKQILDKEKQND